jgi:hypothetical protein
MGKVGSSHVDAKNGLLELDDPTEGADAEVAPSGVVLHPTIPPSFDPRQYAKDSEVRERMQTVTDEVALEHARLKSMPSNLPPARPPMSTVPGPLAKGGRDSIAEIDLGEQSFEQLGPEEQVAVLRSTLAPLSRVPTLSRPLTELGALLEDPKTAFVLGFVDGILPLETIIDVTGLPELDTLTVLDRMVSLAAIVFRGAPSARA